MVKLEIGGRTAELVFDMASWEAMEERVGLLDDIDEIMSGKDRLRKYREVVEIFAVEGAALGKGEEMPADWLREHMRPAQVRMCVAAIKTAIAEGMRMENKSGEDEVIDSVLAELEKKEKTDA